MMNTIEVIRAVFTTTSRKVASDIRQRSVASTIAPTAPTDAASVGVAMPPRIDPSTAVISISGGTSATRISRGRSLRSSSGTGVAGQDCGSTIALNRTNPI